MSKMLKNIVLVLITITLISCKEKVKKLDYKIFTSDIDNFWIAYDSLENSIDSVQIFQKLYIDKASPEFKKFLELRDFEAKEYVDKINAAPNFWKTVRPLTEDVKEKKSEIDKLYYNMQKNYDGFKAPNICFEISPIRTGGTTSKGLISIGTEIAAVNPDKVDISEIGGFMRNVFEKSNGNIVAMVAHELIHTQQPNGDNEDKSLLHQAITEGAADFIGEIIFEKPIMSKAIYDYGEKHEHELWKEFKQDIKSNKGFDNTDWFYNCHSNRPGDLGYYLGYKIVESYYNNSVDKKRLSKKYLK